MTTSIPGYTYGAANVARSPLSLEDLSLLEQTLLFTDDDREALRQAGAVLSDQVEDVRRERVLPQLVERGIEVGVPSLVLPNAAVTIPLSS